MGGHERLDPEIAAHYTSVSERQRLGPWSLERVRTWELLGRYLPPPPAVVLDIGGAAGIYALPLAADGYQVHLVRPAGPACPAGPARFGRAAGHPAGQRHRR